MSHSWQHHSGFPRAILHIDGDAFFASCEQSRDPKLKGKPVITGKERGIASSMSYEAKARGVTRAMMLSEIKRICPDAIILPSDYETYSILSLRMYNIVRRFTPDVEEYGIDECFADITGLRRIHHKSYEKIAEAIQTELKRELGFTFSIGLGPNKSIAKIASKHKKPYGLTSIPTSDIPRFLEDLPVEKIWGVGPQTTALLNKYHIRSTLEFANAPEAWVKRFLTKPHHEIWQELKGEFILQLNTDIKTTYHSIQKFKTFTPPSSDYQFVFSQLSKNIENACIKARRYHLGTDKIIFFLRNQKFQTHGIKLRLNHSTSFPHEIVAAIEPAFQKLFNPRDIYRQTGIVLVELKELTDTQPDLFGEALRIEQMNRLYDSVDSLQQKFGKHTISLGTSFLANKFGQHKNARGDAPARQKNLFKDETKRKRLAIPMFLGNVK